LNAVTMHKRQARGKVGVDGHVVNDQVAPHDPQDCLDGRIAGAGDGAGAIPVSTTGPVMGQHAECNYFTASDDRRFFRLKCGN
jgi:hypothetical protein